MIAVVLDIEIPFVKLGQYQNSVSPWKSMTKLIAAQNTKQFKHNMEQNLFQYNNIKYKTRNSNAQGITTVFSEQYNSKEITIRKLIN